MVRSLSVTYGDGQRVGAHAHAWGQLVYAEHGAVLVASCGGDWLVPPARAAWLPPGVDHGLTMRGATLLRSLYLAPRLSAALSPACCGFDVAPLLRELILHIARRAPLDGAERGAASLARLLVTLLTEARALPFRLDLPTDPRALRACALMRRDLAADLSLNALEAHAGASARTLQRLFVAQTGLRLSEWRQTARLLHATTLLLEGASVTEAGLASGYAGPSAFIAAFRRRTGQTPRAFRRGA